jgi:hypothetical protein
MDPDPGFVGRMAVCEPAMSKAEIMRQHVLGLYRAHEADGMLPTSGRFLYYESVTAGVSSKQASGVLKPGAKGQRRPDQDLLDALTELRESGQIPWEAIVDETRSFDDFTGSATIADDLGAYMYATRIDPWAGDAPLVLTESRSLAGVLRALTREYAARIAATNGQTNGFLRTQIAPRINDGTRVLYLGDFDFAGGHIEVNTRRILDGYHDLEWERLALTADQVRDHNLTIIQKYDARDKKHHPAVETEALSQRLIVQIVRARLDELLPEPLSHFLAREEVERERLRTLLGHAS